jgi:WD40 repeat protein
MDVTTKILREHGRKEIFLSLARVPNSGRVLCGASDGKVYDLDALAEKPEFKTHEGHGPFVTGVAVLGDTFVSGGYDCKLIWRKLESGEIVRSAENAHARWIRKLASSPDGQRLASVADDMVCRVWDPPGGLIYELRGHEVQTPHNFPSMLYTCAFSADGQKLATADKTGRVCLWNMADGQKLMQLEASGLYTWDPKQRIHSIGGARALAFSPDGKTLAVGGIGTIGNIDHLDGPARVEVFDLEAGKSVHVFEEAKGLIEQLLFHPEGKWFAGLGGDNGGLLQFSDLAEKKVFKSDKAPMHIHAAALSEDGTHLFAAGHSKIAVWEIG